MPRDIGPKSLKEKRGDIATRVRGTLMAVHWKDRRDVYILTNMHAPPVEGNFTDESGQNIRPCVVEDYNAYMEFVDKSERMVNRYGIAHVEVDQETVFSLNTHDNSKCISHT